MISHIYGNIAQCGEGYVIIDVGGIGYHVNVIKPVIKELSEKNEKVKLHTYLNVREDALTLYGFLKPGELEIFKLLISVTRVGPQTAMNILSQIKIEELASAIINEDEKILTRISGLGEKNAKRLILELKDKMRKKIKGALPFSASSASYDAQIALISLGFQQQEAQKAVEAVSGGKLSVEEIIKAALMKLKEK